LLAVKETTFIIPQFNNTPVSAALDVQALAEQAKASRADHLVDQYTLAQNNDELALQKAMAAPDVTVGASYDQHSSYASHYVGLQISLPLPLFNRNQGNIRSAQFTAKAQEYTVKNGEFELRNEVYNAVEQFKLSQQLLDKNQTDFYERYDNIFNAMLKSFQQRQISLPEFVDFFDSYKETKIKILQLQLNQQKAIADLNYAVGTNVIAAP